MPEVSPVLTAGHALTSSQSCGSLVANLSRRARPPSQGMSRPNSQGGSRPNTRGSAASWSRPNTTSSWISSKGPSGGWSVTSNEEWAEPEASVADEELNRLVDMQSEIHALLTELNTYDTLRHTCHIAYKEARRQDPFLVAQKRNPTADPEVLRRQHTNIKAKPVDPFYRRIFDPWRHPCADPMQRGRRHNRGFTCCLGVVDFAYTIPEAYGDAVKDSDGSLAIVDGTMLLCVSADENRLEGRPPGFGTAIFADTSSPIELGTLSLSDVIAAAGPPEEAPGGSRIFGTRMFVPVKPQGFVVLACMKALPNITCGKCFKQIMHLGQSKMFWYCRQCKNHDLRFEYCNECYQSELNACKHTWKRVEDVHPHFRECFHSGSEHHASIAAAYPNCRLKELSCALCGWLIVSGKQSGKDHRFVKCPTCYRKGRRFELCYICDRELHHAGPEFSQEDRLAAEALQLELFDPSLVGMI